MPLRGEGRGRAKGGRARGRGGRRQPRLPGTSVPSSVKWSSGFLRARRSVQTPARVLLQTEEVQPRGRRVPPRRKGREGRAWRDATACRGTPRVRGSERVFLGSLGVSVGAGPWGSLRTRRRGPPNHTHRSPLVGGQTRLPQPRTPPGARSFRGASTLCAGGRAGPARNRTGARTSQRAGSRPPAGLSAALRCSCLLCPLGRSRGAGNSPGTPDPRDGA